MSVFTEAETKIELILTTLYLTNLARCLNFLSQTLEVTQLSFPSTLHNEDSYYREFHKVLINKSAIILGKKIKCNIKVSTNTSLHTVAYLKELIFFYTLAESSLRFSRDFRAWHLQEIINTPIQIWRISHVLETKCINSPTHWNSTGHGLGELPRMHHEKEWQRCFERRGCSSNHKWHSPLLQWQWTYLAEYSSCCHQSLELSLHRPEDQPWACKAFHK